MGTRFYHPLDVNMLSARKMWVHALRVILYAKNIPTMSTNGKTSPDKTKKYVFQF